MISLVLATVGRTHDVGRFLVSLSRQDSDLSNIELIVVDQNHDDRLSVILGKFQGIVKIVHIKEGRRGLSNARNIGLGHCSGEYIGFPDDDCEYSENVISCVLNFFSKNSAAGCLSVRTCDKDEVRNSLIAQPNHSCSITPENIRGCSFTFFFRKSSLPEPIEFDVGLGVGASTPYQAGEEEDFVIRFLAGGGIGIYSPETLVYHPAKEAVFSRELIRRRLRYSAGRGYCFYKNRFSYRRDYYLLRVIFGWARILRAALAPRRCVLATAETIGFYRGWIGARCSSRFEAERE